MSDTDKDIVELDEKELVATIVKQVQEGLDIKTAIADALKDATTEMQTSFTDKLAEIEKTVKKTIEDQPVIGKDGKPIVKSTKEGLAKEIEDMTPAQRFFAAAKAMGESDNSMLKALNEHNLEVREKAGYNNTGVSAEGGFMVPDPEFDAKIYENLPDYGVAAKYATNRTTDRTAIRWLNLTAGLQFFETLEAGVKSSNKLAFSRDLVNLRKFAVIVPATEELEDDAIIDYWNLVTVELSRALARKIDELTFTDVQSGIVHLNGIQVVPVSGAGSTITWDNLLDAESRIEDGINAGGEPDNSVGTSGVDTSGYKWFMRKETWFRLLQTKAAGSGEYLAGGSLTDGWIGNINHPTTPWGTPVVFTRVLPRSADLAGGTNAAFAVFGDLSYYQVVVKRAMDLKLLTEATIVGTDSSNFNLATQDGQALRAVTRVITGLPSGVRSLFVAVGTGTVS